MNTQRHAAWLFAAALFSIGAGTFLSGCGIRRAIAQGRLRQGLIGRMQGNTGGPESVAGAEKREIAGVKVSIWRPASQPDGSPAVPAPLVIFSHGFHGSSTQSTFLMKALAAAGYLVIAPNHKDAGFAVGMQPKEPFTDPAAWSDTTYKDRADDIRGIVEAMKKDPAWAGKVDWSKVALAGHSLGGYTVLGLAGAWPAWKLPGVKAVLALSPFCTPLAQKGSLGSMKVPVMYQGGTQDFGITPAVIKGKGAYDLTASPAYFVEFDGAGHFAWTDLNPRYQASIDAYCIAFLDKYVRGSTTANPTLRRPDVADLRLK